jgi:hypothetical protein
MIEEFRHRQLQEFAGLPVFEFAFGNPEDVQNGAVPENVEDWAWRVSAEGDEEDAGFAETFAVLLETVDVARIRALIVGVWYSGYDPSTPTGEAIGILAEHAERFPQLEALFLGDVDRDHSEVSWLHQSDPARLFPAFPRLRRFGLRGTTELSMEPIEHATLEELTLQGGGLPAEVTRALTASKLPALTGLELYLGTAEYNGSTEPADLGPILSGESFPNLRHLGLRDAENADAVAAAVAHAPVVARLESLDLSLGAMTDAGAAALLAGQPLTHLARLDLHHHYLSEEMMQRVWAALPGVAVNMDEQEEAEEDDSSWGDGDEGDQTPEPTIWRYIAVAE